MTTVSEIAAKLAERTRPENAASWDPVGIQLGDPDAPMERIGVCHEVNEEVLAALRAQPLDLLITYHPLLFHPTSRVVAGRSSGARAFQLIRLGVNLLVTHTDFDAAPGGAADALAALVKLRDVEPFGGDPDEGTPDVGRVGDFTGSVAVLDAIVSDAFGHTGLRITGDRQRRLNRVAVVPGAGADFVESAAEVAEALVTGDVPHHRTVLATDLGLTVVDPGHAATERPGMSALLEMVTDVAGVPVVDLTRIDPKTWG